MNSNILKATNDIGADALQDANNPNKSFARDGFGYTLNYFGGDYYAIDPNKNLTANNFIADVTAATYLNTDAPNLFNGNISHMVTSLTDISPGSPTFGQAIPQLTAYRYCQLPKIRTVQN